MSKKKKTTTPNLIAHNKKARHHYELLEFMEAGISLKGAEVKSLRQGQISFRDSYVDIRGNEAYLVGAHIAPYSHVSVAHSPVDPDRARKLLLHAHEIKLLKTRIEQKGLTVVPVKMYFRHGKAKLEIAIARGKQLHDHRETLKRQAQDRDMERDLAH